MEQHQQDKGLRKAMKTSVSPRLSTNFTFRTMLKVRLEDAQQADETFSILMGDKVEPRRDFIEKNAQYVSNLDV